MANVAVARETWNEILHFHHLLASDDYVEYLDSFYRECIARFGSNWHYMDIVNVLYAAAKVLQPENYLEIGVRRGRSVCTVVQACPAVNIHAFDMWIPGYAGMDNPGPEYIRGELTKHNFAGKITFVDGDSHITIPRYLEQYPDLIFDLITVDGDHSTDGAYADLCAVIPRLAVGGVIVFDDIIHPAHPFLLSVWRDVLKKFPDLSGYEFTETGYGVAFAVRRA